MDGGGGDISFDSKKADEDEDENGDGTWRPLRPRCLGRGEAEGRSRATAMVRMVSSICHSLVKMVKMVRVGG